VPPQSTAELAKWFAEAIRVEIAELERNEGSQRHELHHGRLVNRVSGSEAQLEFAIAGGAVRIPDDSSGKLKTQTDEFIANVTFQVADVIRLRLTGKNVPDNIPRAELIVDEIGLLRRLLEVLSDPADHGFTFGSLSARVFHPETVHVALEAPAVDGGEDLGEKKAVIQQALGSEVTFVWGPPGTGKTFVIARLVASLVTKGERVLVMSHTKAAVDQALYEAVKDRGEQGRGPLAGHPCVAAGEILRIGEVPEESKLPPDVQLDIVRERKAGGLRERMKQLAIEAEPLRRNQQMHEQRIKAWDNLVHLSLRTDKTVEELSKANTQIRDLNAMLQTGQQQLLVNRSALARAERAWFGRTSKVKRATETLNTAEARLDQIAEVTPAWEKHRLELQNTLAKTEAVIQQQKAICDGLPPRNATEQELGLTRLRLQEIDTERAQLQAKIDQLDEQLIKEAKAIFCTLTKNYVGESLKRQEFSTVIIDEISMALPPLVFLAAARASSRVILVGDFHQLPPIVRSRNELARERLGTDVFRLAGVAALPGAVPSSPVLTSLKIQKRMRPEIASVARELAYKGNLTDHEEVTTRPAPEWLSVLPPSAASGRRHFRSSLLVWKRSWKFKSVQFQFGNSLYRHSSNRC
jgi:hypothetical protein